MFVTDAVFNNGMVVREVQLINMLSMFVTDTVFNNGMVISERQT